MMNCLICNQEGSKSICDECEHKLEKQEETGRCQWCGRLVNDCVCDDDFVSWE